MIDRPLQAVTTTRRSTSDRPAPTHESPARNTFASERSRESERVDERADERLDERLDERDGQRVDRGSRGTARRGKEARDGAAAPPLPVDLSGWDVILADGTMLGVVDRFLLDTAAQRPRYLAVAPVGREGLILIPIGIGSLDPARRQLKLKKQRADRLRALPIVTADLGSADVVDLDVACAVYSAVTGKTVSRVALKRLYRDPVFDPSRLFGRPWRKTPT